ncbi:MAG: cyclic nucleotide-binding domain-containing protein [Chitinispirillaceae bacterium]
MHLFRENNRSRELYVIQSGRVKVYKTMGSKEIERAMMGKGAVLGETALIFGKPRSASAVVVEECTTLQIESEVIQRKIQGVPSWWMKKLSLYNKFKDMDPSV